MVTAPPNSNAYHRHFIILGCTTPSIARQARIIRQAMPAQFGPRAMKEGMPMGIPNPSIAVGSQGSHTARARVRSQPEVCTTLALPVTANCTTQLVLHFCPRRHGPVLLPPDRHRGLVIVSGYWGKWFHVTRLPPPSPRDNTLSTARPFNTHTYRHLSPTQCCVFLPLRTLV